MNPMKPILFNTDMVRANLEDRKTNTRRLIKPQPTCYGPNMAFDAHDGDFFLSAEKNWLRCRMCGHDPEYSREGSNIAHHWEPPYEAGDILYVRETWGNYCYDDPESNATYFMYRADFPDDAKGYWYEPEHIHFCDFPRWRPSIHMPKEAARLFLRVTRVRVERLQDIDGEQAYREGATAEVPPILEEIETHGKPKFPKNFDKFSDAKKEDWCRGLATATYIAQLELAQRLIRSFRNIWDATIKKEDLDTYGWDANPWVWVIEYERISKEEAMKC